MSSPCLTVAASSVTITRPPTTQGQVNGGQDDPRREARGAARQAPFRPSVTGGKGAEGVARAAHARVAPQMGERVLA